MFLISDKNKNTLNYILNYVERECKMFILRNWTWTSNYTDTLWAVSGDGKVIHLAGEENDGLKDNLNSGSLFTICGKRFNKAQVREDYFWNVVGDSKVYKNNSLDDSYTYLFVLIFCMKRNCFLNLFSCIFIYVIKIYVQR